MSDIKNRKQVAKRVVGLCGTFLRKSVGNEMCYLVLTFDLIDGHAGTLYETDMCPDAASRVLRQIADDLEKHGGLTPKVVH